MLDQFRNRKWSRIALQILCHKKLAGWIALQILCRKKLAGWMDGWVDGWMETGWESGFKDCLQQSTKLESKVRTFYYEQVDNSYPRIKRKFFRTINNTNLDHFN